MSQTTQRRVVRKAMWRLLPVLMAAFVVAYLDRLNISIGALEMRADTGLSAASFGLGAGIFFIAYFFFEVPSNLVLHRVGARRWIARIMWTWGVVTVAMMLVSGPISFYVLRALLGAAEAGFVPGVILYLSYWFPARERGKSFSWFQVAVPISFAFGSVGTGALLHLDGLAGLHGWQWIFIVTGGVAIAYGFVIWFFLPDGPDEAAWLSSEERSWLRERMRAESDQKRSSGNHTLRASFSNPSVWFLSLLYFCIILGQWGIGFWLPQILAQRFADASHFQISMLSAAPWLVALLAIVPVSWNSDRTGERRWHLAIPCFVSAAGFVSSAYLAQPYLALAGTAVALVGLMAAVPVFWNLPTAALTGVAAASGIALINSLGNLSGFVGPYLLGLITEATGTAQHGVALLSLSLAAAGVLALRARQQPTLVALSDSSELGAPTRSGGRSDGTAAGR